MKARNSSSVVRERALLVQVILGRQRIEDAADSLAELERLADTAGAVVVGCVTQRRPRPAPGLLVGEGKLADIQLACREGNANIIIFDNDLSPSQVNNLDLSLGIKVIDRTELILQIFAGRAKSAEAQVQVELAQLQYLISRLPTSEKQARFKGGIGMKGPGESPLQLRNEPMRRRMRDLKRKLEAIQARRQQTRGRGRWPLVSLVGYTNAGKSTLLNAFTGADAYVDDRLFATLDTKTRLVHLGPERMAMLSDTVGFIRDLPHGLVASFRSTLDVAAYSDLLLVVSDASHPYVRDHLRVVDETLREINAHTVPRVMVWNKCDAPDAVAALPELQSEWPESVAISARDGKGLDDLRHRMVAAMPRWARDD
ncbi:MAG: GTPase HflX [Verrucomicrobia bacterium]|nr:GTPase HflX [Verrucomicrobiota bacterium]